MIYLGGTGSVRDVLVLLGRVYLVRVNVLVGVGVMDLSLSVPVCHR